MTWFRPCVVRHPSRSDGAAVAREYGRAGAAMAEAGPAGERLQGQLGERVSVVALQDSLADPSHLRPMIRRSLSARSSRR